MPRTETIARINAALERLPDDRLEDLASLAAAWTRPTVYSTLSDADKRAIDDALDALDRGEGESWDLLRTETWSNRAASPPANALAETCVDTRLREHDELPD
jgi:hypothetical protein